MICTTTCAPDAIVRIAKRADEAGLSLVEAPISGTSAQVRDGSAMALIAGPPEAIAAVAGLFDILCPQRVNVGKIGDASRTKLAINLILQNNRAALAEGIAFAEGLGLAPGGAYTLAMAVHRLGQDVVWATDFGADPFSAQVLSAARREGLDEAAFRHHPTPQRSLTVALSGDQK